MDILNGIFYGVGIIVTTLFLLLAFLWSIGRAQVGVEKGENESDK